MEEFRCYAPTRESVAATSEGFIAFELDREDAATLATEISGRESNDLKAAAIVKAVLRKLRRMSPVSRVRLLRRLGVRV